MMNFFISISFGSVGFGHCCPLPSFSHVSAVAAVPVVTSALSCPHRMSTLRGLLTFVLVAHLGDNRLVIRNHVVSARRYDRQRASMLRRFGNKWQRTVAILATLLAILFSPLPFSSLNATFSPGHISIAVENDNDHLDQRLVGSHLVKSSSQHRHGHNSADHSHDLPTGISATPATERLSRSAWAFARSAPTKANQPTSIERPPKTSAIA